MNWQDVWSNRAIPKTHTLEILLYLDGFDIGAGRVKVEAWQDYVTDIKSKMGIKNTHTVYEVGCGAGAFLYALKMPSKLLGGCDYSKSQLQYIRKVLSNGIFEHCPADKISTHKYDFVLSNSVFQYLDKEQAKKVIALMIAKAKKAVGIFDIPDEQYLCMTEMIRRQTTKDYDKLYSELKHTYYDREFFKEYNPVFIQGTPTLEGENRYGVIIKA